MGVVSALACISLQTLEAQQAAFRVPPGFEVTRFASDELAHDIYSLTIDPQGRIVVAGREYIKILHDDDQDGHADRATLYADVPQSGAMGMVFDGNRLICVGDNSLMSFSDVDGDDRADGPPTKWAELRHPEHGAHAILKGPDGWFYLICGNDAGVVASHATTPTSPVTQPDSGALLRFSPDGGQAEIVAHGFRNPYDFGFNELGHIFTVDSDGERDHHLPWYAPTRLFDIGEGQHHGWVLQGWTRSWSRPAHFFDSTPRVAELGRGSPTGLVVYRHQAFPLKYHGAVLSCCWTLGKVYSLPLDHTRHLQTYRSQPEVFLETAGDVGFAPVDLEVGPDGDLYVAIGGRRTQGGVFRVRYVDQPDDRERAEDDLASVLRAPQPLSAWSRADWEPQADRLGKSAFRAAIEDLDRPWRERVRAIEILVERFDGMESEQAAKVSADRHPPVVARVAWALGRKPKGAAGMRVLAELTHHRWPLVTRSAWEALAVQPEAGLLERLAADDANWEAIRTARRRQVRDAVIRAATIYLDTESLEAYATNPLGKLATMRIRAAAGGLTGKDFVDAGEIVAGGSSLAVDAETQLEALRILQLALGDVELESTGIIPGYTAADIDRINPWPRASVGDQLARSFPAKDPRVNQELARVLAILSFEASPDLAMRLTQQLVESQPSGRLPREVGLALHYLMSLSHLEFPQTPPSTEVIANVLIDLHHGLRAQGQYVSRNWPLRVGEMFERLTEQYPDLEKSMCARVGFRQLRYGDVRQVPKRGESELRSAGFGLPEHSLFVLRMQPAQRLIAARQLISTVADEDWTSELVDVAALLPSDESRPLLRALWDDGYYRDQITSILAQQPQAEDRGRFVAGLLSPSGQAVQACVKALKGSGDAASPDEIMAALKGLRTYCATSDPSSTREGLVRLLEQMTGEAVVPGEVKSNETPLESVYEPWAEWFGGQFPSHAALLDGFSGHDGAAWRERLANLDWSMGDAEQGEQVFRRRSCHGCHSGSGRLGPDLAGAATRFSREDLFAAIVQPSKDVSPVYQTRRLETGSGKIYHGLVVYESPDGTLIQTSATDTVRIAGEEIRSIAPSTQSLMPEGLFQDASDQELVDLYAYLRSLK